MRHFKLSLHLVLGFIVAVFLSSAFAADVATHKIVNGVTIYLGVLPSEMILGHPQSHTEADMHGGVPSGEHRYHVMVALFEAATGKRITGAQVKASVSEVGLPGTEKKLEPMPINGTISYGNYFNMSGSGVYRIHVQVRSRDAEPNIEADFEYQHARI